MSARDTPVVIVGAGIAGLSAALGLAPRPVVVVTKTRFGAGGSSLWAQGGVAVAMAPDDDPDLHTQDTLAAGAGIVDGRIADLLTHEGPRRIEKLIELGTHFDRDADGRLVLGREAAHSRRRILHAHGDATGAEMVRALSAAVERSSHIEVREGIFALDLLVEEGRVTGIEAVDGGGRRLRWPAPATVLATGGIGQAFLRTTNPREATGDGLAMAARAGARLADLEFVQFHPTALAVGSEGERAEPLPLLTEALRGEGAVLRDGRGRRFMPAEHPLAELAPRDVVARAIWQRVARGEEVTLDARKAVGGRFPERFPTVFAICRARGLDPRREPIPVSPAAHYHMGGVAVDGRGRGSLAGLWACGEVSSTGVHGANRLASNSLLEALVFGARVAEDIGGFLRRGGGRRRRFLPRREPPASRARSVTPGALVSAEALLSSRRTMWEQCGLERDAAGLGEAARRLAAWAASAEAADPLFDNLLTVGRLVVAAALRRRESRGSHWRTDCPGEKPGWRRRQIATAAEFGVETRPRRPRTGGTRRR